MNMSIYAFTVFTVCLMVPHCAVPCLLVTRVDYVINAIQQMSSYVTSERG